MAPTARASDSLTEHSKRERKAIVLLSLAFITLSALAHFVLGGVMTPWFKALPIQSDAQTPGPIVIDVFHRPTPAPTPPPTPIPTPAPAHVRQTPAALASANPRASAPPVEPSPPAVGHSGPGHDWPDVLPSATPGAGTGTDATAAPNSEFAPCRMLHKVVPDYPEILKTNGVEGTVAVIVAIGPDGSVVSVRVGQSSGVAALDGAAMAAARASTYACPPAQGRPDADLYEVIYTFKIDQN